MCTQNLENKFLGFSFLFLTAASSTTFHPQGTSETPVEFISDLCTLWNYQIASWRFFRSHFPPSSTPSSLIVLLYLTFFSVTHDGSSLSLHPLSPGPSCLLSSLVHFFLSFSSHFPIPFLPPPFPFIASVLFLVLLISLMTILNFIASISSVCLLARRVYP